MLMPQTRIQRFVVDDCVVAFGTLTEEALQSALSYKNELDTKERIDWHRIKHSMDYRVYQRHITRYPDGFYREFAETKMQALYLNGGVEHARRNGCRF